MTIKAERLKKGDTIGVIAPASPPDLEKLKRALLFLEKLGLNVKMGKHVHAVNGYLAGTDEERMEDLHDMFADKEVKGIICARGGFGTARIADELNYRLIQNNPKIFVGYSDITFLHTAIYQQTGLVTFHGPMLSSDLGLKDVHDLTKQSFMQLFNQTMMTYTENISSLTVMNEGEAEGEIIGGNLSLLVSTLGTAFEMDTKGKILFIEEIGEEPYRVDKMLNQLKMAGKLTDAAGILICDFHNCEPKKGKGSLSLDEVLIHYLRPLNKPVMTGFKIGHCSPNIVIPIGVTGRMNTKMKTFVAEPGVQ